MSSIVGSVQWDSNGIFSDPPAGTYYDSLVGTSYDWQHKTVPQSNANSRVLSWPRGKVINACAWSLFSQLLHLSPGFRFWEDRQPSMACTMCGLQRSRWMHGMPCLNPIVVRLPGIGTPSSQCGRKSKPLARLRLTSNLWQTFNSTPKVMVQLGIFTSPIPASM